MDNEFNVEVSKILIEKQKEICRKDIGNRDNLAILGGLVMYLGKLEKEEADEK